MFNLAYQLMLTVLFLLHGLYADNSSNTDEARKQPAAAQKRSLAIHPIFLRRPAPSQCHKSSRAVPCRALPKTQTFQEPAQLGLRFSVIGVVMHSATVRVIAKLVLNRRSHILL